MKIYVDLDHVDITEYTQIESGEYNTNKINFIFTPEYKDLVKVAIFGCKLDTDEPKFYKIYLSDDSCYLPSEVTTTSDVISIGVYAFNIENGELKLRYSPTPVKTIVYEGSFREEAENSSSPTPTEIEQIMSRIISLEEITSDLNTRVEALENKACDLDSIKEDVAELKDNVENISGRVDTIESDIDELESDVANTYSKTEVDTLLGAKVDTSTYTTGQATQDEKIAKAELILSQLPKVTGEGTNISLSPTIEYDLEVGYKGDTSQETTTGKNLLAPSQQFSYTNNGITATSNGEGAYTLKGTCTASGFIFTGEAVENYTIKDGDYLHLLNTGTSSNNGFVLRTDNGDITNTFNTTNRIINLASHIGKTIKQVSFYCNNGSVLDISFTPMIVNSSSATTWEKYTGGIPSPNPNYPQDIQVVTGTQTITISNSDNTESQTYTLHLGDEELAKIGTSQDKIYYDNGKWYKLPKINNQIFNGTETGWSSASYGTNSYQIAINDLIPSTTENQNTLLCMSNLFRGVAFANRTLSGDNIVYPDSTGSNYGRLYIRNTSIASLNDFKTLLGTTNLKFYYVTTNNEPTEITNEILLQDLNYIKEHITSFPDTTNISTSGNLSIIITASALKQLS